MVRDTQARLWPTTKGKLLSIQRLGCPGRRCRRRCPAHRLHRRTSRHCRGDHLGGEFALIRPSLQLLPLQRRIAADGKNSESFAEFWHIKKIKLRHQLLKFRRKTLYQELEEPLEMGGPLIGLQHLRCLTCYRCKDKYVVV